MHPARRKAGREPTPAVLGPPEIARELAPRQEDRDHRQPDRDHRQQVLTPAQVALGPREPLAAALHQEDRARATQAGNGSNTWGENMARKSKDKANAGTKPPKRRKK